MNRDDWRHANACIRCHSHKLKCRRPPSHSTCLRCAKFHVHCVPRIPKRQGGSSSYPSPATPASTLPGALSTPEPPKDSSLDLPSLSHETSINLTTEDYDEKYALNMSSMSDICSDASMRGWSDQLFTELPADASGFDTSFTGNLDIPAGFADLDSDVEVLTTHSFVANKGSTTLSDRSTISAPSEALSSANTWVKDLSKTSALLFAFESDRSSSPSRAGDDITKAISKIEYSFTLATELSDLMKRFYTSLKYASHSDFASRAESIPRKSSLFHDRNPGLERGSSEVLQEQSHGLLLMSSYLRPLSIFSNHLESLDSFHESSSVSGEAQVSTSRSLNSTSFVDQPIAQRFMVVSMIEFHLRRLGAALRVPNRRDRQSEGYEYDEGLHGHGVTKETVDSMSLTGLGGILPVIHEQQALLLRKVSRMRACLMEARGS